VLQRHTENLNYGTTRLIGAQTNALPQRLCTVKLCEASRAIDATRAGSRPKKGGPGIAANIARGSNPEPLMSALGH